MSDRKLQEKLGLQGEAAPDIGIEEFEEIKSQSVKDVSKQKRPNLSHLSDDGEFSPEPQLTAELEQLLTSERKWTIVMLTTFPAPFLFSLNFLTQGRGFEAVVSILAPLLATGLIRNRLMYKADDANADMLGIPRKDKHNWFIRMMRDTLSHAFGYDEIDSHSVSRRD